MNTRGLRARRSCQPLGKLVLDRQDCNGWFSLRREKLFCDYPKGVEVPEKISHIEAAACDGHTSEAPRLHVEGPEESSGFGIESGHRFSADGKHDAIRQAYRRNYRTLEG